MTGAGGPPVTLPLVRAIEERAFNAWPALEVAVVDGWLLRFAEGYTKRSNSANPLAPTAGIATLLPLLEALYRRHGLPPCVRMTPLAQPSDAAFLDAEGWRSVDESVLMLAPLAGLDARGPADGLTLSHSVDQDWIDGYADARQRADLRRDTLRRIVEAIRPETAFATVRHAGAPVAFGMAVVERGMVGLFDIATRSEAQRRGFGRAVIEGLMAWGRRHGAMQAYLQVATANTGAVALYQALGFREGYRYDYRLPPS